MKDDFDFCKELNELMDLNEKIEELSKQIYLDIIVFGQAKILIKE
jgi:hypothetical protein